MSQEFFAVTMKTEWSDYEGTPYVTVSATFDPEDFAQIKALSFGTIATEIPQLMRVCSSMERLSFYSCVALGHYPDGFPIIRFEWADESLSKIINILIVKRFYKRNGLL